MAREQSLALLEINLERDPTFAKAFETADPSRVFDDLALLRDHRAAPADSLLFIDEIQAAPEVLAKLRWFAEEMPELAVVAAGSLLDFALAEFSHSMPVGRVSYAYVEPLGFPEYLEAHDHPGPTGALYHAQPAALPLRVSRGNHHADANTARLKNSFAPLPSGIPPAGSSTSGFFGPC